MAVNKVILLGNLGSDINVRHLQDGRPVGNVNIATTENWRDREGEKQKHTEWHRLSFFGRQAEIASEFLHKGSQVYIEGQLRTRKWTDKESIERQITEIRVTNFQMLGSRLDRDGGSGSAGGGAAKSRQDGPPANKSSGDDTSTPDSGGASGGGLDDMHEDIPW